MVTNLNLLALEIWILYHDRANCENRIKELKYDFAADKFNQKNFFATEATLSTVMLSYNLMSFFRKALLKSHSSQTLKTLRYKIFGTAGYVIKDGKKRILNLAGINAKKRLDHQPLGTIHHLPKTHSIQFLNVCDWEFYEGNFF